MLLQTKCILNPIDESDGIRVSIMSGFTLNDGITPHPLANTFQYNARIMSLAPPRLLLGDYYKRGLPWDIFETRYISFIEKSMNAQIACNVLFDWLNHSNVTLLCIEESPLKCHRRLIAKYLQTQEPKLNIRIH